MFRFDLIYQTFDHAYARDVDEVAPQRTYFHDLV